jgi:hypothetical protein
VVAVACPEGPKEREATSAMSFRQPWMETVTSGEAWLTLIRIMRARTRRWPMRERLEVMRRAQLTVDVLSHHAATCSCLRRTSISNTRYWRRRPAISRSLMVISPPGLDRETRRAVMSAGHASRQTTGCRFLEPHASGAAFACVAETDVGGEVGDQLADVGGAARGFA